MRIFKLARSWTSFQNLLITIGKTVKDISNFSVLLLLFMFTYALLGMELFSHKIKYNDENEIDSNGTSVRNNYDTLLDSLTTIFVVLIGEDWNNVMYMHYRVIGGISLFYFLTLMIFGNIILLNLFLAILLRNFETKEDKKTEEKIKPKKTKSNPLFLFS